MNANKSNVKTRVASFRWVSAGFALAAVSLCAPSARATTLLTLSPSPNISGAAGSTIGWGFTLTNDSNYVEITSAQFCLNPVSFPACSAPTLGTFTDFISQFNNVVIGFSGGTLPGSVTQSFDPLLLTGLGSFDIFSGAAPSSADVGQIVLTYNMFDADPNGPGPVNQLLFDQVLAVQVSLTVTPPQTPVPEPSGIVLGLGGLLAISAGVRRYPNRLR